MPQNEHIELHRKRHGRRLDHEERTRKKEAREPRVSKRFGTTLEKYDFVIFLTNFPS